MTLESVLDFVLDPKIRITTICVNRLQLGAAHLRCVTNGGIAFPCLTNIRCQNQHRCLKMPDLSPGRLTSCGNPQVSRAAGAANEWQMGDHVNLACFRWLYHAWPFGQGLSGFGRVLSQGRASAGPGVWPAKVDERSGRNVKKPSDDMWRPGSAARCAETLQSRSWSGWRWQHLAGDRALTVIGPGHSR